MSRITAKTPKWFKAVRNVGLILATVSTAILTAPVALPAAVISTAGYLALAGGIAAGVAQTAKENE